MRLILFIFMVIAMLGCDRGKQNRGGGVVDGGGGGDLIVNTREEVVQAVAAAWKAVTASHAANPLYVAYVELKKKDKRSTDEEEVFKLLQSALSGEKAIPEMPWDGEDADQFRLENLSYLANKRLNLNENGLCSGPGDHKFLASVTSLNRSGEICVSVSGLMNLPSGNLNRDLIALFAHEIAHLNGAGEALARKVQTYFLREMATILRENGAEAKQDLAHTFFRDIQPAWQYLIGYETITAQHFEAAKTLSADLRNFKLPHPYLGPDIRIAHPELYPELKTKIRDCLRKAGEIEFVWHARLGSNNGKLVAVDLSRVQDLARLLTQTEQLLLHYLFGDPPDPNSSEWEKIDKATAPETLTRPETRPKLPCDYRICAIERLRVPDEDITEEEKKKLDEINQRIRRRFHDVVKEAQP